MMMQWCHFENTKLGGAVASLAILTKTELFLPIIGIIFVAEVISDVIQVAAFDLTAFLNRLISLPAFFCAETVLLPDRFALLL